jgi:hypothetical protein
VRPSLKALSMAVGSGTMIGTFLILIDLTPDDSGLVPLIANRAVNAAIMLLVIGVVAVLARRRVRARADVLVSAGASTLRRFDTSPGSVESRLSGVQARPPGFRQAQSPDAIYSHSIVPGGLEVTSSTTRLTPSTSFVIRFEILASTSYGSRVQSAVIASSEDTGRSTIGCP